MLLENRFFIAQASLEPSFTSELLTLVHVDTLPTHTDYVAYDPSGSLSGSSIIIIFHSGTFFTL
jgi:hypothetical protein